MKLTTVTLIVDFKKLIQIILSHKSAKVCKMLLRKYFLNLSLWSFLFCYCLFV